MSPTISVIIPTHNREILLKKAIESVLSQTILPLEIIVVDDTNSLETETLVNKFSSPILRFVRNQSSGASSSRNLGASYAKGDYVAFLDDDDIWLPNKLELQLNEIEAYKCDVVFSQLYIQYENSNIKYTTKARNVDLPLQEICIENFLGATISSVVKRELFEEVGGFDITFPAREEYDLWIKLIQNKAIIRVVEKPLAISYRSFERSRISSNLNSYIQAIEMINEKHDKLILDTLSGSQIRLRRSRQYEFLAAQAISIGLKKNSATYYFKSFINLPKIKPLLLMLLSCLSSRLIIKIRSVL